MESYRKAQPWKTEEHDDNLPICDQIRISWMKRNVPKEEQEEGKTFQILRAASGLNSGNLIKI